MIRKDISLSEVLEYYKNNKVATFDEDIDQFGDYFITAGRIAALILAPTPTIAIESFCAGIDVASLRASKLLSWLPDKFKYKNRGREKLAIERYELANVVNFMLLQIAIKNGVKEIILPVVSTILEHVNLEEDDRKQLTKIGDECEKESSLIKLPSNCFLSKEEISNQSFKIVDPILSNLFKHSDKCKEGKTQLKKIDLLKTKDRYADIVSLYYNAFVINFSGEFPEFKIWADTTQKAKILKELNEVSKQLKTAERKIHEKFIKQTEQFTKKIDEFRKSNFIAESGFPSFHNSYKELFELQTNKIINSLSAKIKENVEAHQNKIKDELNKPLIDNADIEGIVYPKNKEIYVAQSFRSIDYIKKLHKKDFLNDESLNDKWVKGENISNFLLQTLIDPNYSNKPIILLGLPGAGKSMLSKMFAGQLCETNDFIPFLVKLRSVASNTANVSEHINKGISKSPDTNWLDWAKEFRERIPVIIMDGFDELMQSSTTELNNYIGAIKEFQNDALHHGIAVRIILTSRTTVMQHVYIPEGTRIIKLDSFDSKRRDLWVKIWNDCQIKPKYKFSIPQNPKIEHLAQEPLLIFMLAVYDFEKSELQLMTKEKNFNQSKLYDSLLISFIDRQLKKNDDFKNLSEAEQKKERELFRLRLGTIALLMFLNNTTHKDTQKLKEELQVFGLHESSIQSKNILGDFFFIHENKSTTEGDSENLNFEFLHKTFGEFLTADFLLRIAFKQTQKSREKIYQQYIFKFCYGYNWLNKHQNIQNFLFEYAPQFKAENKDITRIIEDIIKPDLEALFMNGNLEFPVKENQILPHKEVVEHLGIYSQNLIFLWLAISNDAEVTFEIFGTNEKTGDGTSEPKYESQDRDETNKNKLLWKRFAKLWTLVGNYNATAKLHEWIKVVEKDNNIILSKSKADVSHNFSDSAKVACNDFELLLSFFDNEYKFTKENLTLDNLEKILKKKPELLH
ncbi:MAG: ATP-binding protein [Bacteroidales bacterium]|nr:ATP-binding protein [Bacteroidales bacterium]